MVIGNKIIVLNNVSKFLMIYILKHYTYFFQFQETHIYFFVLRLKEYFQLLKICLAYNRDTSN